MPLSWTIRMRNRSIDRNTTTFRNVSERQNLKASKIKEDLKPFRPDVLDVISCFLNDR